MAKCFEVKSLQNHFKEEEEEENRVRRASTPTSLTKKMVPVREDPCIFLFYEGFAEKKGLISYLHFLISGRLFTDKGDRIFLCAFVCKCVHV